MNIAIFDDEYLEKGQYFIDEQNMIWLHGTVLCDRLGFKNPSEAITKHTDEDERRKEDLNGRLVWFVSEPGVWGMILAAKTPEALNFKRQLKHKILPKIRTSRFYIASNVTSSDLEALQVEKDEKLAELAAIEVQKEKAQAELTMYRCDLDETYTETKEALTAQRRAEDRMYMTRDRFFTNNSPYVVLDKLVEGESIPYRVSRLIKNYMAEKLDIYDEENNSDVYTEDNASSWLKELITIFLYQTGEHGDMGRFYSYYRGYSRNITPDHDTLMVEILLSSDSFTLSHRMCEEEFDKSKFADEMYYHEYVEPTFEELNHEHLKNYKLTPAWNYIIPLKLY